MKKILLTGAGGFIGNRTFELLKEKYAIKTMYENTLRLDDPEFYLDFDFDYDYIIHLGAEAGVRRSHEQPELFYRHNVDAFRSVMTYADDMVSHPRVIYASSSSIYEWWKSPYATTKKMNELMVENNYDYLGLRFHTVYGPNSRKDMFFDAMLRGDIKTINSKMHRDWTHVDDVVSAIEICIEKFDSLALHGAIDVGCGEPTNVKEMVERWRPDLISKLHFNDHIPEGERPDTCSDPTLLKNHGWRPKYHIMRDDMSCYAKV